jgi:hypothetical protein
MYVYAIKGDLIKLGMQESEVREALGPPYLVQLAGVSMVYRWQDAFLEEEANEWLRVRLRRVRGHGLEHAVVDQVEGLCNGVPIALP